MVSLIQKLGERLRSFVSRQSEAAVDFEQQVRTLAEACLPGVRERLSSDIRTMLRSEARGYVRARARRVVRVAAEGQFALSTHRIELLVERAIEHLTLRITRELMTQTAVVPARRVA